MVDPALHVQACMLGGQLSPWQVAAMSMGQGWLFGGVLGHRSRCEECLLCFANGSFAQLWLHTYVWMAVSAAITSESMYIMVALGREEMGS